MVHHPDDPIRVEIRLAGHLDRHWSDWFGGLTLTHESDGTTTLRGSVTDQAQLYGLLTQVRDLGASLISLTPLGAADGERHPTPSATPERSRGQGSTSTRDHGWC